MAEDGLIDVGDVTLFVRQRGERGDRPSVVVVHGGPDWDHSYLLPGLEPPAADRHVVAFDIRGCGRSSGDLPHQAYQPEHVVEDVYRLVRTLGLGQVDLLGFSFGGRIVTEFLGRYPSWVRRVVLASTTAYTDFWRHLDGWDEYHRRRAGQRDENLIVGNTYEPWARNAAPTAIWNLDLLPAYLELLDRVRFTSNWMTAHPVPSKTMRPLHPSERVRILRESRKPVLILHGAQDMGFPVQVAHRLHDALPGSELAVIENAGHMCQFEKPETWSHHVGAFLSRKVTLERRSV